MKKIVIILILSIANIGQAQIQKLIKKTKNIPVLSQEEIGNGLKQALDKGIKNQVTLLTAQDGFYKNELVKILMPDELKKVDNGLRAIGLGNLVDEGVKVLNRAAEDAVKTATPIFVTAVKEITFNDAKTILLGEKNAATLYLQSKTQQNLYQSFSPVVEKSFTDVGADAIWSQIISKYNTIPFVKKVNPNLVDYVTNQALKGVFTMIALEEVDIREKVSKRDTALLKKVFASQQKK